jgi:3-oxoacyl-[acyl-carrier protein] reductase
MYRDQVVLITGSSRGLGAKLVKHFIDRNATVVGFSRTPGEFKHPRFRHFPVDIRDEKQVREAFAAVRSAHGKVDVLINNAGVAVSQFTVLTPLSSAEDVFRTNFIGTFLVTREAAKLMMAKKYGRIVMLSSVFVPLAPAGGALYSASKAALTQFALVLAKETADHGITCNVLGIAAIETEMWKDIPKKKLLSLVAGLSRKGISTLEDVTNAVDFLAGKASGAVTAQVLYLGGAH